MRELVLNHASLFVPEVHDVTDWLADTSRGIAALIAENVAEKSLRMHRHMTDVQCRPGLSLSDALHSLRERERDAYLFLVGLTQKFPLREGLAPETETRLLAYENLHPTGDDGDPLLLCAVNDGIAVGFPSSPEWNRDQLRVTFRQLQPDGELAEAQETIDNLTRSAHAQPILGRHRERLRHGATAGELWERRREAFPDLLFGPEVERHLKEHARLLPQIQRKLGALDESARAWKEGPAPRWTTHVTAESRSVETNPKLKDARLFQSSRGGRRHFLWHGRVGDSFRVHIRFEPKDRSLEIGYIGPKLPTQ